MAVSPDLRSVFVTAGTSGAVAVFDRTTAVGTFAGSDPESGPGRMRERRRDRRLVYGVRSDVRRIGGRREPRWGQRLRDIFRERRGLSVQAVRPRYASTAMATSLL